MQWKAFITSQILMYQKKLQQLNFDCNVPTQKKTCQLYRQAHRRIDPLKPLQVKDSKHYGMSCLLCFCASCAAARLFSVAWSQTKMLGKCTISHLSSGWTFLHSSHFFADGAYFCLFKSFCYFIWRRCVHTKCTVWKWSLSLGENVLMPL